ncbi:MAG: hypothetical protein ABSB79_11330 [Syntrophales bacterium]
MFLTSITPFEASGSGVRNDPDICAMQPSDGAWKSFIGKARAS